MPDLWVGILAIAAATVIAISAIGLLRRQMRKNAIKHDGDGETEYSENYSDYNKTLRTWFVTFGLGGPVLFMLHPELASALKADETLERIVVLFLTGCSLQILVALVNKISAWELYYAAAEKLEPSKAWCKLSEWFWIDAAVDVVTAGCFAWVLQTMLSALLSHNADNFRSPSVHEIFEMKTKCAELGKEAARISFANATHLSHYSQKENRCFVRLQEYFGSGTTLGERIVVIDGQTGETVATADSDKQNKAAFEQSAQRIRHLISE